MINAQKYIVMMMQFMIEKIESGQCDPEELESTKRVIEKELVLYASPEDIAKLFGQKESNVRNVISRHSIPKDKKPKRRIMYRFDWFLNHLPDSWRSAK